MSKNPSKLILMRHGQSRWNELNLFTGWVDVPLSEKGMEEAIEGGKKIKDIPIDIIFTSSLMRAQQTAMLVMLQHSSEKVPVVQHPGQGKLEEWALIYSEKAREQTVPVYCAWQINERMYGELQGLNKAETIEKFGAEQVQIWRRSYAVAPPGGESLKDTAARSIPYFKEEIVPVLKNGLNVLVSAHGNSLRSIIMHLDHLSEQEVVKLELATGEPIIYEYRDHQFIKT
jgi:2,3-bisphosphoglycerate-dependent phosphoglycerate mutase